jgi:poly(A) polymerase
MSQAPSQTRAIEIAADLRARGFQAWLVGGCVRDLILGREPMDYDISTDAVPEELLRLFPKAQLVGAQFGVALVDGIEIATFRSDHSYADGRHPGRVVFETDPKQDVLRRDFLVFLRRGLRQRPIRSALRRDSSDRRSGTTF